jgi:hypothetical protein
LVLASFKKGWPSMVLRSLAGTSISQPPWLMDQTVLETTVMWPPGVLPAIVAYKLQAEELGLISNAENGCNQFCRIWLLFTSTG